MPTTKGITLQVRDEDGNIIGHLRNFGCENDNCTTGIVNGRRWHALPAGFAVTLPDYHFHSADEAIYALIEVS